MAVTKNCFTFIWKIKNFSFCSNRIDSPSFFVPEMGEIKWKLAFFPYSKRFEGGVACYFARDNDDCNPEQFELDHELSFLDRNGFVLHSEMFLKQVYKKGEINWDLSLHEQRNEICSLKKDMFIPDGILTIRCRIWESQGSITQSGKCIAKTCIETECITFVGIIKKFSDTHINHKNLVCFQSSTAAAFLSSVNLSVTTDGKLAIEMNLFEQSFCMFKYKIFIRDIFGNKMKFGHGEFHNCKTHIIPLTLLKEHLMENKRDYLPNDVLTIECEVTFPAGTTTEKLDDSEFGLDFRDIQENKSNAIKANLSLDECPTETFTTLKDDISSLFRDSDLCDTKLKTATETFPAHIAILSARSPVFKSMFTTEMKEKTNKCVDIDDLDTDTVRRMLLYIYTDTLDDLTFESTKSLYFAADKYNIVSLKRRCSNFLKMKLLESNCCDVLLLADEHQDEDLRNAVQNYITKNDEVVFLSDGWKDLERNNSQLTTEVLRNIYKNMRRT